MIGYLPSVNACSLVAHNRLQLELGRQLTAARLLLRSRIGSRCLFFSSIRTIIIRVAE